MTMQELALLALKVSVLAIVFALGLKTSARDIGYLFGKPSLLVRSILSMNIVMLVFMVIICLVFPLPQPVKIALIALSLSPVPPILPGKQIKAGGSEAYADSLLVIASIGSLVLMPLALMIVGKTSAPTTASILAVWSALFLCRLSRPFVSVSSSAGSHLQWQKKSRHPSGF